MERMAHGSGSSGGGLFSADGREAGRGERRPCRPGPAGIPIRCRCRGRPWWAVTNWGVVVGSGFRWHNALRMRWSFARIPASAARQFFRFSWRIREPYGCLGLEPARPRRPPPGYGPKRARSALFMAANPEGPANSRMGNRCRVRSRTAPRDSVQRAQARHSAVCPHSCPVCRAGTGRQRLRWNHPGQTLTSTSWSPCPPPAPPDTLEPAAL